MPFLHKGEAKQVKFGVVIVANNSASFDTHRLDHHCNKCFSVPCDSLPLPPHTQEASSLSSLKAELEQRGVPLYGILLEELGARGFKRYLKGELFLDQEVMRGGGKGSSKT